MKKTVSVMAVVLTAALVIQPYGVQAKSMSDINSQLNQLDNQSQSAKQQKEDAAAQKQKAQHYKNKTMQNLKLVMEQLNDVSEQLTRVAVDIENTEDNLRKTKKEIQEATDRIAAREKTLESRVRLMYTDGTVSYLDVLLSSTSFNDFITRVDSIKTIVDQDQFLLDEHKKDKALVVSKKKELDAQYAYAKSLYAVKQNVRKQLDAKEEEKQRLIASYNEQIIEADEISEESDQMLVQLAGKRSELIQQKNKLQAEQAARAARARAAAAAAAAKRSSGSFAAASSYTGGSGALALPVSSYRLSSGFGPRTHPISGVVGKMHTGIDMAAPQGTDIHAAESGVVIVAEWWSGYGNTVVIDHGNGLWTLYGHIRSGGIKVRTGQTVTRGQKIAEVGSTGNSTGPHLHFEVRENNSPVNPMNYL
ncbi:peptidoglycan DD-metalloendopeptidase family protein [Paenibacillus sp. P96]|uniref:Peptidoglycan DD-metalloendopeptidase family protein n=1 Tax=Paenibacillus zeirhizosphaerae TaxID=2987519 RepID=A0ABT9FPP0_9BACL|nr:peptidoglycan DD-metalloendopeptidase family protein [Paenibacillus sp. P96]MDP4096491.1 peptidoglycan DD-metalloendopeptidase family protein [Paenibacillus sp. P96]